MNYTTVNAKINFHRIGLQDTQYPQKNNLWAEIFNNRIITI